jgi:hypothetical protein
MSHLRTLARQKPHVPKEIYATIQELPVTVRLMQVQLRALSAESG